MKTFSRALSPAALLAWGILLLYFFASGRLSAYLIPVYRPGVALTGFVMLAIAAGQIHGLRSGARPQTVSGLFADDGTVEMRSPRRVWLTQLLAFGLLVIPIWAAMGVSKDRFTASAVRNRVIVTDAASLPGKPNVAVPQPAAAAPAANPVYEPPLPGETPAPLNPAASAGDDPAQYLKKTVDGHILAEVTDLLYAADDDTLRPLFENRTVEMTGQFMPVTDAADNRFQIVRMFMVCCAADARPVGMAVLLPFKKIPGANNPVEMSWLRVVGTVGFPTENGRRIPLVHAQRVAPCDPPPEAMLY